MTIVRAKIDMNIPKKRKGLCGQHDKVSFVNPLSPSSDQYQLSPFRNKAQLVREVKRIKDTEL